MHLGGETSLRSWFELARHGGRSPTQSWPETGDLWIPAIGVNRPSWRNYSRGRIGAFSVLTAACLRVDWWKGAGAESNGVGCRGRARGAVSEPPSNASEISSGSWLNSLGVRLRFSWVLLYAARML